MQHVIEFWLQPYLHTGDKPLDTKVYFLGYTSTLEGDDDEDLTADADEWLSRSDIVRRIMDDYDWSLNHNWGIEIVGESTLGFEEGRYIQVDSPETREAEVQRLADEIIEVKRVERFEVEIQTLELTKDQIEFNEETNDIEIQLKNHPDKIKLPLPSVYELIKNEIHGKITLTNSFGNNILDASDFGCLNIGLADIKIFKPGTKAEDVNLFTEMDLIEGGVFIRDDGSLAIGDRERTKNIRINLSELVKELHVKGLLNDSLKFLNDIKLLEQ